jgi:hypothetical protein
MPRQLLMMRKGCIYIVDVYESMYGVGVGVGLLGYVGWGVGGEA